MPSTTNTSYTFTGLNPDMNYRVTVKARDAVGNVSSGVSVDGATSPLVDTVPPLITSNPVGGNYDSEQFITLTANEESTIYYTLDGTTPTEASSVYSSPIPISTTTTLKYFAKDITGNSSEVETQIYTINILALLDSDSFDRTNSDVVGNTSEGRVWTEVANTNNVWGIRSDKLEFLNKVADGKLVADFGVPDCTIEVTITKRTATNSNQIVGRWNASDDYILIQDNDVFHFTGGWNILTPITGVDARFVTGDKLKVIFKGSSITVYVNDVQKATYTTTNTTGTKHGLGSAVVGSQFDDFKVYV